MHSDKKYWFVYPVQESQLNKPQLNMKKKKTQKNITNDIYYKNM